jgi:hypothetical protein
LLLAFGSSASRPTVSIGAFLALHGFTRVRSTDVRAETTVR